MVAVATAESRTSSRPIGAASRRPAPGVHQVQLTFGYMDHHDVVGELRQVALGGRPLDIDDATFFLGRETVESIPEGEMPRWREELFVVLHRGAESAARFYDLPSHQVFEVGTQVEI